MIPRNCILFETHRAAFKKVRIIKKYVEFYCSFHAFLPVHCHSYGRAHVQLALADPVDTRTFRAPAVAGVVGHGI